jgi:hypothetical protein
MMYRASRISYGRKWWRRFRECAGDIWYGVQFGCWRGGRAVASVPTVWAGFDSDGSRLPWKVR